EKLMTYEQVQSLKPEAFNRFCGVGSTTFAEMVSVLEQQKRKNMYFLNKELMLFINLIIALFRDFFHLS
ncbi:hypothetical protein QT971_27565, partial [Microcoleus sp. herbarium19]|uniref:hypothetical protein n=1 Tax=unclassified Microcoleus TaxID=2642155 RepID=UPI003B05E5A8